MALYHDSPYTLEAETTIVDPAPLSISMTEAIADQVVALSAAYASGQKIAVTAAQVGVTLDGTITVAPVTALKAGFRITWLWGDGQGLIERSVDLVQTHTYPKKGTYKATAIIFQPGLPTIDIDVLVTLV